MKLGRTLKTIITGAVASLLLVTSAFATNVSLLVNDSSYPGDLRVSAGRIYVPVRQFCEGLGYEVAWDSESRAAIVYAGDQSGIFSSANNSYIWGSSMYVSIRALAEEIGGDVEWNGATGTASYCPEYIAVEDIGTNWNYSSASSASSGQSSAADSCTYTQDDLYWLARIIYAEARGESMDGKIAVGNVILARVASGEFPDTVYDVIFDSKYAVQYQPVSNGSIYNTPDEDCIEAARRALEGESAVSGCLYFFNPTTASSSWISKNRSYITTIGNHDFYA